MTGERSSVLDVPNESTEPLVILSVPVFDAAFQDRWNAWPAAFITTGWRNADCASWGLSS
jgi:hypothetical protein